MKTKAQRPKNAAEKMLAMLLGALPLVAGATSWPPYEFYEYVAETTDDPPVNYMKVCEPGRSGEANATYVVLGIAGLRTYQAVAQNYSGDLVIPSHIDGLPVRKINEAAFLNCAALTSVTIPSTVREVGARAFSMCLSLTNVTFAAGVCNVGASAFSNCVSLTSLRFPKTLSRLGGGCFQGCISLTDVYFEGSAPRLINVAESDKSVLGEAIFRTTGYNARCRIHINENTYGWIAPYVKGVPEKWPIDYGYLQAHETVAEKSDGSSETRKGLIIVIE